MGKTLARLCHEVHCQIPEADVVLTSQSGFPLLREQWVKRFKA
jgi:hypothetical protein